MAVQVAPERVSVHVIVVEGRGGVQADRKDRAERRQVLLKG